MRAKRKLKKLLIKIVLLVSIFTLGHIFGEELFNYIEHTEIYNSIEDKL